MALTEAIQTATKIRDALTSEVYDSYRSGQLTLDIVNFHFPINDDTDHFFEPQNSPISVKSLADWFWPRDPEIAKRFDASVEARMNPQPAHKPKSGAKTVNAQIRTIAALSKALIGEFTGQPHKDAEVIQSALDQAGIELPVSIKTMASYLKESENL